MVDDDGDGVRGPHGPEPREELPTPLSRLVRRARRWLAALVAVALLVQAGTWLVDEVRFRVSGTAVVETLEGELADAEVADAVLLVRAVGCDPGTGASGTAFSVETSSGPALVTNRHVVQDAQRVTVRPIDGVVAAEVTAIRVSDTADVAVLEVGEEELLPPSLALYRGRVEPGASVHLVGFPAAMPFTTDGTVAEASRTRLLLDLEVRRGASGSPVVDDGGRVVGQVYGVTHDGLGMATPAEHLRDALDDTRPIEPC